MKRFNNVLAVVLGLETNGLSVVRSLGRAKASVIGIDSDLTQVTALSKYTLGLIKTPDLRKPDLIDTIISTSSKNREYALFPTMDDTVIVLSDGRDRLPENIMYRLPDKETVRNLMHKGSFREICQEYGLLSPGSAVAADKDQIESALNSIRLPAIMKSTLKQTGPGPKAVMINNEHEAYEAFSALGEGEVILEEWIPGTDRDVYFCLQAYSKNSKLLGSFTGRKIRQWPPLVGGTASAEPVDIPKMEEATTAFFCKMKMAGLCSMEYKFDSRDNNYYAIEPTVGRSDFQSGIASANGINLPLMVFGEMTGTKVKKRRSFGSVKWIHSVADARSAFHYINKGELTRREWRNSVSSPRVTSLFSVDDPGPWVIDLFRRIKSRLSRMFSMKKDDIS